MLITVTTMTQVSQIPDGLLETSVEVDWVRQLALGGKSLLCVLKE